MEKVTRDERHDECLKVIVSTETSQVQGHFQLLPVRHMFERRGSTGGKESEHFACTISLTNNASMIFPTLSKVPPSPLQALTPPSLFLYPQPPSLLPHNHTNLQRHSPGRC